MLSLQRFTIFSNRKTYTFFNTLNLYISPHHTFNWDHIVLDSYKMKFSISYESTEKNYTFTRIIPFLNWNSRRLGLRDNFHSKTVPYKVSSNRPNVFVLIYHEHYITINPLQNKCHERLRSNFVQSLNSFKIFIILLNRKLTLRENIRYF